MKESALVIIKPDAISKGLTGFILNKFEEAGLNIIAVKMAGTNKALAENHYANLKGQPFFDEVIKFFIGKYHKKNRLMAIIYYGESAIKNCRKIAGATNPEEATPKSLRGAFGRITTKGIYENVVHVSGTKKDAKREIQLWFKPREITISLYATEDKIVKSHKERVWL